MRACKSSIRREVAKHFAEFFLEAESNFEHVNLDSSTSVLRQLLLSFVHTAAQNADSPQHRAAGWRFIDWNEVEQRELLAEAKRLLETGKLFPRGTVEEPDAPDAEAEATDSEPEAHVLEPLADDHSSDGEDTPTGGQVCDRGNIITFRSIGGTILNEFTGHRIEFERAGGVYRLIAGTSAKRDAAGTAEAQPASPGIVPVLASDALVEQHELTHLPFRSWCRHCVRAKGKESPHHESSPGGVSKFATEGEDGTPIIILAGYDGLTKAFFVYVVPCKGTSHGYAERALAHNVLSTDHQKVIYQEPSIIDVKHKAGTHIPTVIVYEESPVGDSNANGSIVRANQTIQGQIRAIKDYTERQIGPPIGLDSSVLKWLVRHAAWTLTTFHVGGEGMTTHQRIRGKPFNQQIAAFGEQILFKPHKTTGSQQKLAINWMDGCWLGFNTRTGEHIVSNNAAVVTCRSTRRRNKEERSNREMLLGILRNPGVCRMDAWKSIPILQHWPDIFRW